MTTSAPTAQERETFYAAAVVGLRALDAREPKPRRFGSDADARWRQFAGALGDGDRLDILLRDAAGTWGAAFSPAECFGLFGLADDEPFGPDWSGLSDSVAKRLLADATGKHSIESVTSALGVKVGTVSLHAVSSSTKLVLAGASAVSAVAQVFAKDPKLSWTDQVLVVASTPLVRQLAGLAAVLVGARGRTALIRPAAEATTLRALGFAHIDAVVASTDAEADDANFARSLGGK
ncbi:MAG: hypothetical protein ABTQ32_02685 [Myxococcaceae bacterium]